MTLPVPILLTQYRLSRVYSGGVDLQSYNRIICFTENFKSSPSPYFIEGFSAKEIIFEGYATQWNFRKYSLSPQMKYVFDRLKVIGSGINDLMLRERLSINPSVFAFEINEKLGWDDLFNATIRYMDASSGKTLKFNNAIDSGSNANVEFYDRDVRGICRQRNVLVEREAINPSPPPEAIAVPLIEKELG